MILDPLVKVTAVSELHYDAKSGGYILKEGFFIADYIRIPIQSKVRQY